MLPLEERIVDSLSCARSHLFCIVKYPHKKINMIHHIVVAFFKTGGVYFLRNYNAVCRFLNQTSKRVHRQERNTRHYPPSILVFGTKKRRPFPPRRIKGRLFCIATKQDYSFFPIVSTSFCFSSLLNFATFIPLIFA